jgi:alpha-galactosidase
MLLTRYTAKTRLNGIIKKFKIINKVKKKHLSFETNILSVFITIILLFVVYIPGQSQKKAGDGNDEILSFHKWAPVPPMGWNSWDCYGPTVVEDEIKANADYMAKNLKKFGWEYIVVDIRWYVENDKAGGYNQKDPVYVMDEYGRLLPAVNRFPSAAGGNGFKPLADYVHIRD